jgi:4-aminobutyrate aminotransferase / (S)-3-amino-2-methylpropionate transaminase / 5-aminovalerate transaminase
MKSRKKGTATPLIETRYRRIMTDLPAPQSQPLLAMREIVEPRAMLGQPPFIWDSAKGISVRDPYGNQWLDWSSGVLVTNIGHSHPAVQKAIMEKVSRGLLFSYCFATEDRIRLANKLVSITPAPLQKIFFFNTGSESVEGAIKLARTYMQKRFGKQKNSIVSFKYSFHGRTMGAQLAGGYPEMKAWLGRIDKSFFQAPFPDGYHEKDTSFALFEKSLEKASLSPHRIAAVIMEPYQGGGASFAPEAYVKKLRAWCRKNDILLIFDEVQSGFGRTGKLFAFEHYGIAPDLLCLGKGISGSLPLSAIMGPAEILDCYGPGSMTSTHGGHALCCAAALANLEILLGENIVENAAKSGAFLKTKLQSLTALYPYIGALHGKGMVYGLHIINPHTKSPDGALASQIVTSCFRQGLLLFAPVGTGAATIKICPPLTMSKDAIAEGVAVLARALVHAAKPLGYNKKNREASVSRKRSFPSQSSMRSVASAKRLTRSKSF